MSMIRNGVLALAMLGAASIANAGEEEILREIVRPDMPGRAIFERQCAPCHGTGPGDDGSQLLPGTQALLRKYAGTLPAQLELRNDLSAPVLSLFVRRGSRAMPMFRKGELTDTQIEQIADYLAATATANSGN